MKIHKMLRAVLTLLVLALVVVMTSWFASEHEPALAQGVGAGRSANWIVVASTLRQGAGLLYMFDAKREVLLVYAYHRGFRQGLRAKNSFAGDLQFLAGRHCKWDVLYSQLRPYPMTRPKQGMLTPRELKNLFDKVSNPKK